MVIKEAIEKYYEEKLKGTQGSQDVFDRIGARGFRKGILRKMVENN
jgi:cell division protein FtsI/penicillin-binding protein 2